MKKSGCLRQGMLVGVVSALLFGACDNPADNGENGNTPGPDPTQGAMESGLYIACDMNGVHARFDVRVDVTEIDSSVEGVKTTTMHLTAFNGTSVTNATKMFSVFIPGTAVRTYTGAPITHGIIDSQKVFSSFWFCDSLVHSTVTLTRNDGPGDTIGGHFFGVIKDTLCEDSIVITKGTFRAVRPMSATVNSDYIRATIDGTPYEWKIALPATDVVSAISAAGMYVIQGSKITQGGYPQIMISFQGTGNKVLGNEPDMMVFTSAKSRLIKPGVVMSSEIP